MEEKIEARNKRVPAPLTRPEFVTVRNYAARKKMPMSRVLLQLMQLHLPAIEAGEDPLQGVTFEPLA